ncbi:MAG TPA: bifunctional UDP-sugar hydrolase/5'-nucleotidase [Thermoanaerobaculia bacterium]|jgi:5'-nucleotidase|nr:bifunctional UDP-sugar hydrolase/5'-nucleotidase [Thermoanaerobaculia bacterium]
MIRRIFVAALLVLTAACATVPPPAQPARFKILQINDVYKIEGLESGNTGGLARVRTLREHLESDGTPVLVLHGGDALYPSVMSKYLDARPMVDVMNLLDGDAAKEDARLIVTFGNHEFDNKDAKILLARLNESAFQWVSTNVRWCNPNCDQRFPKQTDLLTIDLDGLRVGLFGAIYPLQKSYVKSTDVIASARDAVAALRGEGARVVIAITHQDMPDDEKLMQQVPGIDLIVGGHDHLYMQQQVNGKWITKADADAKSAIVYDITIPPGAAIRTTPLRIALDTSIPKDAEVDARVQQWLGELSVKLGGNQTIGRTENLLEGVEPVIRGRESALGNLLTDAAREHMQTDVAVLNGGSVRINDNIVPGPITTYDMEGIFYYTNTLVAFRVTGQQLLDMLRNSVSRVDAGDGRFLQVSGLSFAYHPRGGSFVVNAEDVNIGGKPLDVSASYTVASLDYLYTNGSDDGYTLFAAATRPPKVNESLEADFRKTVEAYLKAKGTVDTEIEGRIVRE